MKVKWPPIEQLLVNKRKLCLLQNESTESVWRAACRYVNVAVQLPYSLFARWRWSYFLFIYTLICTYVELETRKRWRGGRWALQKIIFQEFF